MTFTINTTQIRIILVFILYFYNYMLPTGEFLKPMTLILSLIRFLPPTPLIPYIIYFLAGLYKILFIFSYLVFTYWIF